MDFFARQDAARRSTGRLVLMFIAAVLLIIAAVYLLGIGIAEYVQPDVEDNAGVLWWNPLVLLMAGGGALLIIGGGTLYKLYQLRAGGAVIAEQLGGRLLLPGSADPTERRLLNVVEEMAIASGSPVPAVYLLDKEMAINAFAAGYKPERAVIGVTRGTAERLERDELQGVIAHEFSHILSGDMQLNLRLVGILHGILVLGIIGYFVLRYSFFASPGTRRRSRSGEGGGGVLAILAIGGGLAVIGFIGTFFGNLIKAALSRQREYYADASAVQFTRNPGGIGDALKKIGGLAGGASLRSPNAPEASHMFFGRAVTKGINSMFSTHPPLAMRIKRIEPGWDGQMLESEAAAGEGGGRDARSAGISAAISSGAGAAPAAGMAGFAGEADGSGQAVAAQFGQPGMVTAASIAAAQDSLNRIPPLLRQAAEEPFGARALIFCLLLSHDETIRGQQLAILQNSDAAAARETQRLLPQMADLDRSLLLPVIELTAPALARLTPEQERQFRRSLRRLIEADQRIELFEWILHRLVLRSLSGSALRADVRVRYYGLQRLTGPCEMLLSALAVAGHDDDAAAARAFAAGAAVLGELQLNYRGDAAASVAGLSQAVEALNQAAPKLKRRIIEALQQVIAHDRQITMREKELFRAVAASLGAPAPR